MNLYVRTSFALLAVLMSACVFISEPDVGASAPGPEFGSDFEDDDSRGTPPDEGGNMASEGGDPDPNGQLDGAGDAGTETDEDAETESDEDAETESDGDAETSSTEDLGTARDATISDDADVTPSDATVTPQNDMGMDAQSDAAIEVPRDDCSDVEWDCTQNGYCDPADRPECALTPGFGACYAFSGIDDTDPEAYARCCAEAGSCNQGRFCEPEPAEFSYCWLIGRGATCYVGDNPISDLICDQSERTRP